MMASNGLGTAEVTDMLVQTQKETVDIVKKACIDALKIEKHLRRKRHIYNIQIYLKKLQFFKRFTFEQRCDLAHVLTYRLMDSGESIYNQGDENDQNFYALISGVTKMIKYKQTGNGKYENILLRRNYPGDTYGELGLCSERNEYRRISIVVDSDECELLVLHKADYMKLFSGISVTMKIKLNYLRSHPVMKDLKEKDLRKLGLEVQPRRFQYNEMVRIQDTVSDKLCFITSGVCQVLKRSETIKGDITENGIEISDIGVFEQIGLEQAVLKKPYPYSILAVSREVEVFEVNAKEFIRIVPDHIIAYLVSMNKMQSDFRSKRSKHIDNIVNKSRLMTEVGYSELSDSDTDEEVLKAMGKGKSHRDALLLTMDKTGSQTLAEMSEKAHMSPESKRSKPLQPTSLKLYQADGIHSRFSQNVHKAQHGVNHTHSMVNLLHDSLEILSIYDADIEKAKGKYHNPVTKRPSILDSEDDHERRGSIGKLDSSLHSPFEGRRRSSIVDIELLDASSLTFGTNLGDLNEDNCEYSSEDEEQRDDSKGGAGNRNSTFHPSSSDDKSGFHSNPADAHSPDEHVYVDVINNIFQTTISRQNRSASIPCKKSPSHSMEPVISEKFSNQIYERSFVYKLTAHHVENMVTPSSVSSMSRPRTSTSTRSPSSSMHDVHVDRSNRPQTAAGAIDGKIVNNAAKRPATPETHNIWKLQAAVMRPQTADGRLQNLKVAQSINSGPSIGSPVESSLGGSLGSMSTESLSSLTSQSNFAGLFQSQNAFSNQEDSTQKILNLIRLPYLPPPELTNPLEKRAKAAEAKMKALIRKSNKKITASDSHANMTILQMSNSSHCKVFRKDKVAKDAIGVPLVEVRGVGKKLRLRKEREVTKMNEF